MIFLVFLIEMKGFYLFYKLISKTVTVIHPSHCMFVIKLLIIIILRLYRSL